MRSFFLMSCIALISSQVQAQQLQLVNSGEVLKNATVLSDSGRFDLAIQQLLTVPKRDTNYVEARLDLATAYMDNKQPAEALAVMNAVNAKGTRHQSRSFVLKGRAYEKNKEFDKAIGVLKTGLERYPFSAALRYQLAATYHNKGDYENAVKSYFHVLEVSPYYSGAHMNLGRISIWQGRKTHAMLSMGIYLALATSDNENLKLIDDCVSNQVTDEGSETPTGSNDFDRLDQIIRSRIAMEKKFKTQIPIDVPTVRQYELLFQQLASVTAGNDDPWSRFYLPVYKSFIDKNVTSAFIYHILTSSPLEQVKKWKEKNKADMEKMFDVANTGLRRHRGILSVPASLGVGTSVMAEYDDENRLSSLGTTAMNVKTGPWIFFADNNEKLAEGTYTNGKKTGIWKYYNDLGQHTSSENEETNLITEYYPNGNRLAEYIYRDGKVVDKVELFYPCGAIKETRNYKDGVRSGKGKLYFQNGMVSAEFEYADDKLTGEWIRYNPAGKISGKWQYKDGLQNGPSETYYVNGQIQEKGSYAEDELDGPWIGYYMNGQVEYKGQLEKGKRVGEWRYFRRNGQLSEIDRYSDGELDGESSFYFMGKVYLTTTYRQGKIVKYAQFDESGKPTVSGGSEDGTFDAKLYHATGQLAAEGKYVNGVRSGLWTIWSIGGIKKEDNSYKEGKLEGRQVMYHMNGAREKEVVYSEGELNGLYVEYYPNGKLKMEGWYAGGKLQQQWKSYHINGQLDRDYYYLDGQVRDTTFTYSHSGKLYRLDVDDTRGPVMREMYNSKSEVIMRADASQAEMKERITLNGSLYAEHRLRCGLFDGEQKNYYPDGSLLQSVNYSNGDYHGTTQVFEVNGRPYANGTYVFGQAEGLWLYHTPTGKVDQSIWYSRNKMDSLRTTYFDTGTIQSVARYEDDERQGLTKFYAADGVVVVEKFFETGELARYRAKQANGQFGEWLPFKKDLTIVAFYPGGQKAYEETYQGGVVHGKRRIYYPTGKVLNEATYKLGEYDGPHVTYYANGKVCATMTYADHHKTGTEEWFDEAGLPVAKFEYENDERNGTSVFYTKGVKSKEVVYFNSNRDQ